MIGVAGSDDSETERNVKIFYSDLQVVISQILALDSKKPMRPNDADVIN